MRICDPMWDVHVTQEQLKALFERNKDLAKRNSGPPGGWSASIKPPSLLPCMPINGKETRKKYGNIKVEFEGMKFDSKKELKCWQWLKLREGVEEIKNLRRQVPFLLFVEGKRIGKLTVDFVWEEVCSHVGDFPVWQTVVADCKSPPTRKETAYRLRKKIFEAQYAPLVIREL